jgi:RNA polymerase sigma-70 factor (ECF subfamily)
MVSAVGLGDDAAIVSGLCAGDDAVFTALINRYHTSFVRVAHSIVHDRMAAEDVAQETWLAVLRGIDGFQQRSSLRTWLYRILVNIARARARTDRRMVPLGGWNDGDGDELDEEPIDRPDISGPARWRSVTSHPDEDPEACVTLNETAAVVRRALVTLPPRQRAVVEMRDLQGFTAEEVSELFGISPGNQRVLLHRARLKLRDALRPYVSVGPEVVALTAPVAPSDGPFWPGRTMTRGRTRRSASARPSASHAATM